jgi:hypothetical protein
MVFLGAGISLAAFAVLILWPGLLFGVVGTWVAVVAGEGWSGPYRSGRLSSRLSSLQRQTGAHEVGPMGCRGPKKGL